MPTLTDNTAGKCFTITTKIVDQTTPGYFDAYVTYDWTAATVTYDNAL